jgi:hypothetical protein
VPGAAGTVWAPPSRVTARDSHGGPTRRGGLRLRSRWRASGGVRHIWCTPPQSRAFLKGRRRSAARRLQPAAAARYRKLWSGIP